MKENCIAARIKTSGKAILTMNKTIGTASSNFEAQTNRNICLANLQRSWEGKKTQAGRHTEGQRHPSYGREVSFYWYSSDVSTVSLLSGTNVTLQCCRLPKVHLLYMEVSHL